MHFRHLLRPFPRGSHKLFSVLLLVGSILPKLFLLPWRRGGRSFFIRSEAILPFLFHSPPSHKGKAFPVPAKYLSTPWMDSPLSLPLFMKRKGPPVLTFLLALSPPPSAIALVLITPKSFNTPHLILGFRMNASTGHDRPLELPRLKEESPEPFPKPLSLLRGLVTQFPSLDLVTPFSEVSHSFFSFECERSFEPLIDTLFELSIWW